MVLRKTWRPRAYVAIGVAALLVGCSHAPIPVAENFPYSAQLKVRSAGHWDVLADDFVRETFKQTPSILADKVPVYVELPQQASTFDNTFRELLVTRLVRGGYVVTDNPAAAGVQLRPQVQLVRHHSDRPHFIPGFFTALTAGLYVAHYLGVHAHTDAAMAGGLGFAALADAGRSHYSGGPTHTELVLTATLKQGDRYLARNTSVYYIEDRDTPLFQVPPRGPNTREFKVTSQ